VATGQSIATGETVTTNDFAVAKVVPIAVHCDITLFSSFDLDNNTNDNHVTLPADTTNTPVEFILTVCNDSTNVDQTVSLDGLPPLFTDSTLTATNIVPATTNIAKGQCITIDAWILVTCATPPIVVTVQGTAIANNNFPCVYDAFGRAITSAASTCNAINATNKYDVATCIVLNTA